MRCKKILTTGQQCRAFAQKANDFCFRHDPLKAEAKLIASIKGGKNRVLKGVYGNPSPLKTPEDIKRFLNKVINGVWAGEVPVPVGSSMGFLAKCWLEAHNVSKIQATLEELESTVNSLVKGSRSKI